MRIPDSPVRLALLLAGAGLLHLVRPQVFEPIVPRALAAPRALVYASGAAEIACAVLVADPATRRAGGLASAALFVAVFPANVQMAVNWRRTSAVRRAVACGRLPLQVPLVLWALRVARSAS